MLQNDKSHGNYWDSSRLSLNFLSVFLNFRIFPIFIKIDTNQLRFVALIILFSTSVCKRRLTYARYSSDDFVIVLFEYSAKC